MKSRLVAGIALLLLGAARPARAQEAEPEPEAPVESPPEVAGPEPEAAPPPSPAEVKVTGERSSARKLQESAEAVTVVELGKAKQQTADLGEVLARTPGVSVRRTGGLGSGTLLSLNGLQNDQIRIFVDGVPIELAGYPFGIANIPVNIVERVEIYRGVVPARFGLDALGGAINVVTTRAGKSFGTASYQIGSFGVQRLSASGRYQDAESGLFFGGNAFVDLAKNNYIMSDREIPRPDGSSITTATRRFHDGYRSFGGQLEGGVVDRKWAKRLLVRAFGTTFDKDLQSNAVMSVPYGEVTTGETSVGGGVQYEVKLLPKLELEVLATYAYRNIDFRDVGLYRYRWTGQHARPLGVRTPARGEITGQAIDQTTFEHLMLGRVGFIVPFHPEHTARLYATPQRIQRSSYDYVPGRTNFDLSDRAWELVLGAEYEQNLFDKRLSNIVLGKFYWFQPTSDTRVTPLGRDGYTVTGTRTTHTFGVGDSLRYRFSESILGKVSYEYAARLPRPDELFGNGALITRNPDLQPERSHNFNVGPRFEEKGTPAGDFIVDVNAFWRETTDQIVLIASQQFAPYRNIADTRTRGVEGSLWWRSPGRWLTLDGSTSWVDSRNISADGPFASYQGMRIPSRPYLFSSWGARVHVANMPRPDDSLDLFYNGRWVQGFFRGWEGVGDPEFKLTVPAQISHSLGISYFKVLADGDRYTSTIEVDNLMNSKLFDVWGVQRPGRSFNFKIAYQM